MTIPKIATIKNEWLSQQVDVQFPTKESIAGLALYRDKTSLSHYEQIEQVPKNAGVFGHDDIFLVDFHRLTVMFALLQASQWPQPSDQELIVEFLSQIIYSEPCKLYLAFKEGEPVAAAIVTETDDSLLISDVAVKAQTVELSTQDFVSGLYSKLGLDEKSSKSLFIEK